MNRKTALLEWTLAIGVDLGISARSKEEIIVSRAGVDFSRKAKLRLAK